MNELKEVAPRLVDGTDATVLAGLLDVLESPALAERLKVSEDVSTGETPEELADPELFGVLDPIEAVELLGTLERLVPVSPEFEEL